MTALVAQEGQQMRDNGAASLEAEDKQPFFTEPPRPLMRDMPPAEPYPVEAVPEFLRRSILAISEKTQTDPAIAAQSVLSVATLAVQPHVDVQLPYGGSCPSSEFFMTVAESGERKSTVNKIAYEPVRQRERALHEQYDIAREVYLADIEAHKQAVQNAKTGSKDRKRDEIRNDIQSVGPEPKEPTLPCLTVADSTVEGLVKNWKSMHPAQGIVASEGGQLLGGHGFTQEKTLATGAMFSGGWSGEDFRRNRAGDGFQILANRRLSIDLQVQPDVALTFYGNRILQDQGLLARFLCVWPASRIGFRAFSDPNQETERDIQSYRSRMSDLLTIPYVTSEDSGGGLLPRALPFEPSARATWIAFADHAERAMRPGGEYEAIRGLASKLPEHAARLAAVIEVVCGNHRELPGEISAASLDSAIALAQHYASEALRIYAAGRVNPDLDLAGKLWDWINSSWKEHFISLPDIYQRGPVQAIREKNKAAQIAGILTDHGYLYKMDKGAAVGRVKRRDAWAIWGKPVGAPIQ